jgi:hypothetical protein
MPDRAPLTKERAVDWTMTNLWVQTAAGFLGAHAAASAAHDYRFGFLGHSLVGVISGALSGWLFQSRVITMVTASGSLNEPRIPEVIAIQVITGAVIGAIAMLAFGLIFAGRPSNGAG